VTKEVTKLTWGQVAHGAEQVAAQIMATAPYPDEVRVYGVPNGGVYASQAVMGVRFRPKDWSCVESPEDADVFVDDIIDSGRTREGYQLVYKKPFFALVNKLDKDEGLGWVSFPWERMKKETGPEDAVVRLLQWIGEDVERDGLKETPKRVVKALKEMTSGYAQKPEDVLKTFDVPGGDELILLRGVEFSSLCEHHMLPFSGVAHVAYIPSPHWGVVGLSKLARLVDLFARRLQVQERLTIQVADALTCDPVRALGSACVVEATHSCMSCRGVKKGATMVTSALNGVFRQPEVRQELFNLIRG
jgi:GTP cyclohydrolase I